MRGLSKRSFGTLLLISILALFLAAACTGPEGDTGPKGDQGQQGDQGPEGPPGGQGPAGPRGYEGPGGPEGPVGPAGPAGEQGTAGAAGADGATGPTVPAAIILVPKGETSVTQPVVVVAATYEPQLDVYGSGFPAGAPILIEMITPETTAFTEFRGGDEMVTDAGTFKTSVRIRSYTTPLGIQAIQATAGGVSASAPVVVVETK